MLLSHDRAVALAEDEERIHGPPHVLLVTLRRVHDAYKNRGGAGLVNINLELNNGRCHKLKGVFIIV